MADPLLLEAFVLGLAYNCAPGAVNTETIRRGLRGGWAPALRLQAGSILGDAAWAVLALAGLAVLLQAAWLRAVLGLGGAALLLWFAADALRAARGTDPSGAPLRSPHDGAFRTGVALSVANPFGPAFWLGIGGGLALTGALDGSAVTAAAFLAAFNAAGVAWAFVLAGLLGLARRGATTRVFRLVDVACGAAFAWFGLTLLAESLRALGIA